MLPVDVKHWVISSVVTMKLLVQTFLFPKVNFSGATFRKVQLCSVVRHLLVTFGGVRGHNYFSRQVYCQGSGDEYVLFC